MRPPRGFIDLDGLAMLKRFLQCVCLVVGLGVLSACDSAAERGEKHFQKGVELFESGDTARAIIELRNVFRLDESHLGARTLMARIEEGRGNLPSAYKQYLAVTERAPEDFSAQRAAARIAAELSDWDAAERHAMAAMALLSEDQTDAIIRGVELGVSYRGARQQQDFASMRRTSAEAAELLQADPAVNVARRVVIDHSILLEDWEAALTALDAGLDQNPDERPYYQLRLLVLQQLDRDQDIEAQLRTMVERFSDDASLRQTLLRWYISQQRVDDAESYLRSQIDVQDAAPDSRVTLIAFLQRTRGLDAALEEVEAILAQISEQDAADQPLFLGVRASLLFDLGNREEAIAEMYNVIDNTTSSEHLPKVKITLAQMLSATDNPVGARALIEDVLSEDATNIDALQMRAAWMIEDDRPDEALVELRRALDQAPREPQLFALMAQAHERAGNRDLMGEMLSRAVETSSSAPDEALRYAAYLVQEQRLLPAEGILIDALRLQPSNLQLLNALGSIYVSLEDWPRAQGVVEALGRNGGDTATTLANELSVGILAGQNRQEELQALLEQLATDTGNSSNRAVLATIRLRLADGDVQGAAAFLESRLADAPDDPDLRYISAGLLALQGNVEQAENVLRQLLEERPQSEPAWMTLYNLLRRQNDFAAASAALKDALTIMPDNLTLNWARASDLEREGDIEGAIAIYEELYQRNSASPVIANNLASLISSFREDQESLQRAYAIARRLRGTEVAQFQDTYGWIAARLGNHAEALEYLESAAAALPADPTVRYHLARTYAMAGREVDALTAYRQALQLIDSSGRALPFGDEIVSEIARIEALEPEAQN